MLNIGQRVLGRYEVVDLVGSGGQSEVMLASDTSGERVVIKQLVSDSGESGHAKRLARFRREGSIRVGHPGVVEAIDSGSDGPDHYIVFPFIEGADLASVFAQRRGPLPIRESVDLMIALADAVAALHAAGFVHRDLKPENVIVDAFGSPHLIDMGIARSLGEPTITAPETTLLGTPAWMAPEQFGRTDVDATADVYSLGLILSRAITGHTPRNGADTEELRDQAFRPLEPPSARNVLVSSELDGVCVAATSIDPRRRMAHAGEFADALRRACPNRCLACGGRIPERSADCPACRRALPPTRPRLEFEDGQVFLIPKGEFITGRLQIRPEDQRLSRNQCAVVCNGEVTLRDVHAPNPTRVGRAVATTPTRLTDGAEIRFAKRSAVFATDAASSS